MKITDIKCHRLKETTLLPAIPRNLIEYTLVRVLTDEGIEGDYIIWSEVPSSRPGAVAEALRQMRPYLLGDCLLYTSPGWRAALRKGPRRGQAGMPGPVCRKDRRTGDRGGSSGSVFSCSSLHAPIPGFDLLPVQRPVLRFPLRLFLRLLQPVPDGGLFLPAHPCLLYTSRCV